MIGNNITSASLISCLASVGDTIAAKYPNIIFLSFKS